MLVLSLLDCGQVIRSVSFPKSAPKMCVLTPSAWPGPSSSQTFPMMRHPGNRPWGHQQGHKGELIPGSSSQSRKFPQECRGKHLTVSKRSQTLKRKVYLVLIHWTTSLRQPPCHSQLRKAIPSVHRLGRLGGVRAAVDPVVPVSLLRVCTVQTAPCAVGWCSQLCIGPQPVCICLCVPGEVPVLTP